MFILINPLLLEEVGHKALLRALLESNKLRIEWSQDLAFHLIHQELHYEIQLTNRIILAAPVEQRLTYRVISEHQLGEGAFSTVYPVECTLSFPDENVAEYSEHNMLVVKIQTFPHWYSASLIKGVCLKEYQCTNMTKHLRMETPLIGINERTKEKMSFFFMNHIRGVELFDVIDLHYRHHVNSDLLMRLTLKILTAYKEQVLDCGIMMHLDVKPENIMVDMGLSKQTLSAIADLNFSPAQVDVRFIDYTSCLLPKARLSAAKGTLHYMAPEIKNLQEITEFTDEKPDVYSLGICLKSLWFRNYKLPSEDSPEYQRQFVALYKAMYRPELFSFPKEKLMAIHHAVINMTESEPSERWSLDQSMERFNSIAKMDRVREESIFVPLRDSTVIFFKPSARTTLPVTVAEAEESEHQKPDLTEDAPEVKRACKV